MRSAADLATLAVFKYASALNNAEKNLMTSMPSYSGGSEQYIKPGSPASVAPQQVLTAVRLWFASILIGVVGGILGFALTDRDAAVQTLMDGTASLSKSDAEAAMAIGLVIGLVFALIVLGVEVLFVIKMRAGRNWARIVLTVLGALSALSAMSSLTQAGASLGSLVTLASLAVVVAAIVFMYRPAANEYFAKRPGTLGR